ncbi:MAG TPA: hypothetical protein VGO92_07650 [Acidimicrobiales bacterium]|nr:hypothetical protein [Acidimicrobiales bacterium]
MDSRPRPILIIGDSLSGRWDLAWALHEAGIPAEQAGPGEQTRHRIVPGALAGVVMEGVMDDLDLDELAADLPADPETGEVPFLLAVSRQTDPASVVVRVRALLQASGQLQL